MVKMYLKSEPMQVHSMICHRDVDLGMKCLGSLLKFCIDPIELVLHDDGSLEKNDLSIINGTLPGAKLVSRCEADDIILPVLRDYKHLLHFRERSATGMKLVDLGYMSNSDLTMCDTDVCFFRPFDNMFLLPDPDVNCLFLKDITNSYCIKPWQTGPLKLLDRFNCGLMTLRKDQFDLGKLDKLVYEIESSSAYKKNEPYQWFLEQTCWSAASSKSNSRYWDPKRVRLISPTDRFDPTIVCGHFVKSARGLLDNFDRRSRDAGLDMESPVRIETFPAMSYNTLRYASDRIENRWRRLQARKLFL